MQFSQLREINYEHIHIGIMYIKFPFFFVFIYLCVPITNEISDQSLMFMSLVNFEAITAEWLCLHAASIDICSNRIMRLRLRCRKTCLSKYHFQVTI